MLNQIYGPIWQGEGPSAGRLASIVRFMGCNLSCHWAAPGGLTSRCDESQTWDGSRFDLHAQGERWEPEAIFQEVEDIGAPMVIVTGGEPLLHQGQPGFGVLLSRLHTKGFRVEVETNGTITPGMVTSRAVDQFNVSPKLPSSGMREDVAIIPAALKAFVADQRAVFKFVITAPEDLGEVARIAERHGIHWDRLWIMPAGDTAQLMLKTAQTVAPAVAAAGYNFTLRSHLLMYPDGKEPR
jgi:organic radical activating enzyme